MKGREVALANLHREDVEEPCINFCWMTNTAFMSRLVGRDYWAEGRTVQSLGLAGRSVRDLRYLVLEGHFPSERRSQGRAASVPPVYSPSEEPLPVAAAGAAR